MSKEGRTYFQADGEFWVINYPAKVGMIWEWRHDLKIAVIETVQRKNSHVLETVLALGSRHTGSLE